MFKRTIFERILLKFYYIFTASYYRLIHGVSMGRNCKIEFSATVRGNVKLGNNVTIGKFVYIAGNIDIGDGSNIGDFAQLATMPDGKIELGKDCHINNFNVIGSSKKVVIGNHALFAVGVKITDASHGIDNIKDIIKHAPSKSQEVVIGNNCWLGFDVNVIMGGYRRQYGYWLQSSC